MNARTRALAGGPPPGSAGTEATGRRPGLSLGRLSWRRRAANGVMVLLVWLAAALALFPLFHMTYTVARGALPALRLSTLTTLTQGVRGGLANAIVGSLLLVVLAAAASIPVGVLGGTYAAERRVGALVRLVRLAGDALAGVPSIAVGYCGYVALVQGLGWQFSALAGGLALALLMLPYVLRTTDFAVSAVPDELRDASLALGVDQATTVRRVVLRAARPGIITGILLGLGIAVGETAPLIYTAGWSNFMPTARLTHSPVGYLTYVVWTFIQQPASAAHALAYAAALLLMIAVVLLNLAARAVARGGEAR